MSKDIKEEKIQWAESAGRVKGEEVSWWDGQSPSYWWKSNTGQPNSVTLIIVRAFCLHCALLSLLLMIILCSHPSWCLSKSFLRAATCFTTCVLPAWVVVTVKDTGSDAHHLQVNSNKLQKIAPGLYGSMCIVMFLHIYSVFFSVHFHPPECVQAADTKGGKTLLWHLVGRWGMAAPVHEKQFGKPGGGAASVA